MRENGIYVTKISENSHLQTLVSSAKGLDQGVRRSPVVSKDTMVNYVKGIGISSYQILEVRKEESPINHSLWTTNPDHGMDDHGIV